VAARAPKPPRGSIKRGNLQIEIEGLEEIRRGLANFAAQRNQVLRDVLRGPWGRQVLNMLDTMMMRYDDSGWTRRQLDMHEQPDGSVEVGVASDVAEKKHPYHSRANIRSIGTWLESGVKPHRIPRRVKKRRTVLAFGGRVVSAVEHPGFRARRPMGKLLRVHAKEGERLVMEELAARLEKQMQLAGARRTF
jgi:hypothetical protein